MLSFSEEPVVNGSVVVDAGEAKASMETVFERQGNRYEAFTGALELARELLPIDAKNPVILVTACFSSFNDTQRVPNVGKGLPKPLAARVVAEAIEEGLKESDHEQPWTGRRSAG